MTQEKEKKGWLVLSRSVGQSLLVGNEIEIAISEVSGQKGNESVEVAVRAPRSMKILRKEILERKVVQNEKVS